MKTYFVDTESPGLTAPTVLLQYAINDGPVELVDVFFEEAGYLMGLIEEFMGNRFVAHNINFDHQALSRLYNTCRLIKPNQMLINLPIEQLVELDYESRNGLCLKPAKAVDTMILSSKGDEQSSLMAAKPITIRRVPREYAQPLADLLTARTNLPWILFGRTKEREAIWKVCDIKDEDTGVVDPYFAEVKLSFKPSNGLKELTEFFLGRKPAKFAEVALPMAVGEGYAPYAALLLPYCQNGLYTTSKDKTGPLWPHVIKEHIDHWRTDTDARRYGEDDVINLRDLYHQVFKAPDNDTDAILACQIASVRLAGFDLDIPSMEQEMVKSQDIVDKAPINVNSPKQVKQFIAEVLDPMEQIIVAKSCNAETLEKIVSTFTLEEEEECCCEDPKFCLRCDGKGVVGPGPLKVVLRAKQIEEVRSHKKRVELYKKLLKSKRAYPNFRAVGTKSGRLSGTDGLNFQGVDSSLDVRSLFILAALEEVLSGGDYSSQELAIAGTTMQDDRLIEDLKAGKSLHGLFGAELFQTTYEDIMATKSTDDRYGRAKSAVYLMLYGGTFVTMAKNSGVDPEVAERAFVAFCAKYPGVAHVKKVITDRFSAIVKSDDGRLEYKDPPCKYIESIYGFRRHFDTEFGLQRLIFDLAQNLPEEWKEDKRQIKRDRKGDRVQTMAGAICSALYGAAYSVQNGVIRASNNHLIQSAGRTITVGLQQRIWDLQPTGIHPFRVKPMSIHDEIAATSKPDMVQPISDMVKQTLDDQCERIPLLALEWGRYLKSWGDLKVAKPKTHDMITCGFGVS